MVRVIYPHAVSRDMGSRPIINVYNPATLEKVGQAVSTLPDEVPGMVEKARQAQSDWATSPLAERSKVLRKVQSALVERADEIAELVSQETGKPLMESLATDVMNAISVGDFSIERMAHLFRRSTIDLGRISLIMKYMGRSSYIVPRPLGVIGIITPWNYPLAIPYSLTMMSLAAGNAVIIKPSSFTPLTALRLKELMEEAGSPTGLVQVAVGAGDEIGEAVASSAVDRIIFTGHADVGRRIMVLASQRLTPITLELGGKDAFIVLRDAELKRAAKAACWGSFVNSGQTCGAIKRIYVHRSVNERFTALLMEEVRSLRQGFDLKDPTISMGPMISEEMVQNMENQVSRALGKGAKVMVGGKRSEGLRGHYFEPTLISDLTQDMDIVHQETFGPIVAMLTFDTEEEAVHMANDSAFALNGSIWTADLERGKKLATELRAGTVMVNNVAYTYGLGATPWGGRGESGSGRTHGDIGFEELVERQHLHVDKGSFSSEIWWHPYGKDGVEAMHDFTGMVFNRERGSLIPRLLNSRRLMRR
ncbi:MAG TPA: aldehyde dehydrogenase family protein [Methanomassiliicoccales archaeon]|nr:aldehyde dehydrogenase family protein [Methanomassiliicoccales archaeon]